MKVGEKARFADLARRLLDWYGQSARELPWRIGPEARARGVRPDPYRVWLSEIMLQQTTVAHVTARYRAFVRAWPTLADLATARDEDVMAAWAGLGYYARARNLLECARQVHAAGKWPDTLDGLRKLPGIGAYTAGALGALAFGWRTPAIDGNVNRIFARLCAMTGDWKDERKRIAVLVDSLVPTERPAEFAEGLMDLGAGICTPRKPHCRICPLQEMCTACADGQPDLYPVKPVRAVRPVRYGYIYVVFNSDGEVLTERRPDKGLLGGMLGLPCSAWKAEKWPDRLWSLDLDWQAAGTIRHVFTHFTLHAEVWRASGKVQGRWCKAGQAVRDMPSLFARALRLALEADH